MSERRRHDRVELQSQVAVTHVDVVHQLRVINASASGLFLEADDLADLPEFTVGAEVNVRLFDEAEGEDADVLAMARVVRLVKGGGLVATGLALAFTEMGEADHELLEKMLSRRPARPTLVS
jgi:hypothetical protein